MTLALGPGGFFANEPSVGMGRDEPGLEADVEGDGKMTTSSAWAVGKSLSALPSTDEAPRSESIEVHHSLPENFCMSAYLRLKARAGENSETGCEGDFDFDLPLA